MGVHLCISYMVVHLMYYTSNPAGSRPKDHCACVRGARLYLRCMPRRCAPIYERCTPICKAHAYKLHAHVWDRCTTIYEMYRCTPIYEIHEYVKCITVCEMHAHV